MVTKCLKKLKLHGIWILYIRYRNHLQVYLSFRGNMGGAYAASRRLGVYDKITSHMVRTRRPNGYWTHDRLKLVASKFQKRTDFQVHEKAAYLAALRRGILPDICEHMAVSGCRYKRAIYAFEFSDNTVYVGLTHNYNERFLAHLRNTDCIIGKLKRDIGYVFVMFNEWIDIDSVGLKEGEVLNMYIDAQWEPLNIAKAGALGGNPNKWDIKSLRSEAIKYSTRTDFMKGSLGAYAAARRRGLLDIVCKHMPKKSGSKKLIWEKHELVKLARKYKTIKELRLNDYGAYQAILSKPYRGEILSTLKSARRPLNLFTENELLLIAKEYKSIGSLKKAKPREWRAIVKFGLEIKVYSQMGKVKKSHICWTKDKVFLISKEFKSKNALNSSYPSIRSVANRLNIWDQATEHMK